MSTVGRPQRYLLRNKICVSEVIDLTQSPTSTSTGIRNDVGTFTSITAATAASPRISAVIDLIQSPSRPQPITSTGIQDAANVATATAITGIAAGTPSDVSSTMQTAIVTAASQNTDLYAQLQNLEGQEGVIWNAEQMFCALCDLFVGIGGGILVRNCLHQICTICIKKVIVECATIDVKCPIFDCHYSLQDREIHSLLTQSEYERHMNKSTVIDDTNLYKDLLDLEQQGLIYNTESFECKICFTEIDVSQGILIRECLHQYCIDCMRHTINLSEEARIKCPAVDCSCYIHDREIHALLSQEEFDKYTAKTLRIAESQEANSYHCKLANCGGWCIVEDEVNTFDCPVCSSVNCLSCQVIHTGRNCQQYQDEIRFAGLNDDDKRSEMCLDDIVKKNLGMRCTRCKIVIMKREGCDYLKCSMCKTDLCWATKMARWGPGGQGDTSGGCRCRVNNKKCHPNCRNCH